MFYYPNLWTLIGKKTLYTDHHRYLFTIMFTNVLQPKRVNIVTNYEEIIAVTVSSLRSRMSGIYYSSSNYLSLRIG